MNSASPMPANGLQILRWSEDLCRLSYVHAVMPKDAEMAKEKIRSLEGIWSRMHAAVGSKERINQEANALHRLDPNLFAVYSPFFDISRRLQPEKIRNLSSEFSSEAQAAIIAPVVRSKRGANGPTCIIQYAKKAFSSSREWVYSGVFKWTIKEEKISGEVYKKFTDLLPPGLRFSLPKTSYVDFEDKIYINETGEVTDCSETSEDILGSFTALTQIASSSGTYATTRGILLSEKVAGSILFDFARGPYVNLNIRQKEELFKQIGALALVDLICAQTDRIIPFHYSFTMFSPKLAANLGNLMVVVPKSSSENPALYAIDNDIFDHEVEKRSYPSFYTSFLHSQSMSEELTSSILSSLESALAPTSFLFRKLDTEEAREVDTDLEDFRSDLKGVGGVNIQIGIEGAVEHLKQADFSEAFAHLPLSEERRQMLERQVATFQQTLRGEI